MTDNAAQVLELARQLSPREQLELIQALAALACETLDARTEPAPEAVRDPILELIGAYAHELPLIDDIAPSADPDLYLAAEALGPQAEGMHAWEIAPARYVRGPDGRPVRKD
ncbi:MAG: hypothetical protein NZM00_14520 [Anaerolinea sp.]|nr:hypothetical protein [Anaerolinea sp.]